MTLTLGSQFGQSGLDLTKYNHDSFQDDVCSISDLLDDDFIAIPIDKSASSERVEAPLRSNFHLFDSLTSDIKLFIFSFLQNKRDMGNVMRLNKYYAQLGEHDTLWETVLEKTMLRVVQNRRKAQAIALKYEVEAIRSGPSSRPSESPETWICQKCHLIQALSSSTRCEMCLSLRPSINENVNSSGFHDPEPYIIVKSARHFYELCANGRQESASRELIRDLGEQRDVDINTSVVTTSPSRFGVARKSQSQVVSVCNGTRSGVPSPPLGLGLAEDSTSKSLRRKRGGKSLLESCWHNAQPSSYYQTSTGQEVNYTCNFSYYFHFKCSYLQHTLLKRWAELRNGWVWIQSQFRALLSSSWSHWIDTLNRSMLSCPVPVVAQETALADLVEAIDVKVIPSAVTSSATSLGGNCGALPFAEEVTAECHTYLNNKVTSDTIRRVVTKLCKKDWVLCYECLKCELEVQAGALARDFCQLWSHPVVASSYVSEVHVAALRLRLFVCVCRIYLGWVDEIESSYCSSLCSQIQRYRDRTANPRPHGHEESEYSYDRYPRPPWTRGAGGDEVTHTPHLVDVDKLALRRLVCLRLQVKAMLRDAIDCLCAKADADDIPGAGSPVGSASLEVTGLMSFLELAEELDDVPDDSLSLDAPSERSFRQDYIARLRKLPCLATHIRLRNERQRHQDVALGWSLTAAEFGGFHATSPSTLTNKRRRRVSCSDLL